MTTAFADHVGPDRNVGETYLHKDPRSDNRRIKLLDVVGEHAKRGTIYSYETVTNDGAPSTVGRKGKISASILDREYKRVSK